MTCHCPRDLTFPWQPHFDRHVCLKISISLISKVKKSFLVAFFKSLLVLLFVLITFDPILGDFLRFWTNPVIQDGEPRWPPFRIDYAIITSCDVITS